MRKLGKYLKSYWKECALAPLFKLLEACFELFIPLVVASIIDVGIARGNRPYIAHMCALMVGLGMVGLLSSVTAQFFAAKAAVGFSTNVRRALFAHIQTLSFSDLDGIGSSTLITRMTSDVNQVQAGVNIFLRLSLRSICIVMGAMIMAFTIDARLASIFAATIGALFVVTFGLMAISIPLYKKIQEKLDGVLRLTRENLSGARIIRAFAREGAETDDFLARNGELTAFQLIAGRVAALLNPVTLLFVNLATVFLIWRGAFHVNAGSVSQGQLVALVNYMAQILVELIKFTSLVILVNKSIACAGRIAAVLDHRPSMPTADGVAIPDTDGSVPTLAFNGVGLTYVGSHEASLSGVSFEAFKGQTIGIIGDTGSGKSSLISLVPRFYDATEGSVLFHGLDVKRCDRAALRSRIGIVPQQAVLFRGTIRDNLLMGNENASDADCIEAMDLAQAAELVPHGAQSLIKLIEQGGRNLSGGQRQRLTIARALVRKPEVLILDDSFSALDFATDARLRKAIASLRDRMTVIIVSQRVSSIANADRILVIDEGMVVGDGTHKELVESCPIYRELYALQCPETREGGKK